MSASERLRAAEIAVFGLLAAAAQFFRQSQPDAAAADADFLVRSGESEDAPGRPLADPDLLGVICVQALIAGAIFYGTGSIWNYPLLWLLPLATLAKSLAHFRNVVEHTRTQDVGDAALSRLRTIESSRLEAFFFAPLHFNFHAEHHLYPGIPFDKLSEAHRLLAGQPGYREAISIERGYLRFLLRHGIRRAPVAATGSFVSS